MTPAALALAPSRRSLVERVVARLERPVDPAGLAAFRVLYGVLVAAGAARFLTSGTLDKLYAYDAFYFRYPGLAWVPVPTPDTIALVYAVMTVLGVMVALGALYRFAIVAFTALFTWMQLVDLTNYLNHYYLVILLGVLLAVSPAHAAWSVDAHALPRLARALGRSDAGRFEVRRATVPFFFVALLRFQVACVYVFAALAKAGPDWLLYGQPLGLWLPAKDELPVLGAVLSLPWAPIVFSWCGFLYDLTIVAWLSWKRTRPLAYLLVLVFHGMTYALFEIGMFPFIMAVATTAFFDPSWPRRLLAFVPGLRAHASSPHAAPAHASSTARAHASPSRALPRAALVVAATWCAFHVLFPLRCHALGDDVLWDEAGMRFSWRVMVREKSGSLAYHVTLPALITSDGKRARVVEVTPHQLLTHRQANEMIGQPDMILQLAHHIRDTYAARGVDVEVRADALVSLNGRRTHRFIDPAVDLAKVDDTMARPSWVLPAPASPPPARWRP